MKNERIRKITTIGVFGALSLVLYYLRFPLPIFPSFLQVQFSMLPLIILSFCYGYKSAICALLVKTIIAAAISFGESYAIGEAADLIIGVSVLFCVAKVYEKGKTKKNGLIALLLGIATWVVVAMIINYFVLIPIYISLYFKGDVQTFVGACSIIPGINENNYRLMYVLLASLPFNLILSSFVSLITFLVYKRISIFIKKDIKKEEKNE